MLIRSALNFAAHFAAGLAFGALAALVASDRMREADATSHSSPLAESNGPDDRQAASSA